MIFAWVIVGPLLFGVFFLAVRMGKVPPLPRYARRLLIIVVMLVLLPWLLLIAVLTIGLRESRATTDG